MPFSNNMNALGLTPEEAEVYLPASRCSRRNSGTAMSDRAAVACHAHGHDRQAKSAINRSASRAVPGRYHPRCRRRTPTPGSSATTRRTRGDRSRCASSH
jgi:hypothetical protein